MQTDGFTLASVPLPWAPLVLFLEEGAGGGWGNTFSLVQQMVEGCATAGIGGRVTAFAARWTPGGLADYLGLPAIKAIANERVRHIAWRCATSWVYSPVNPDKSQSQSHSDLS